MVEAREKLWVGRWGVCGAVVGWSVTVVINGMGWSVCFPVGQQHGRVAGE